MITVKALWKKNDEPAQNIHLYVLFNDFFGRGVTDENGEASFDLQPGEGEVFYKGYSIYLGKVSEIVTIHI